jgi:PKD repeat protein
MVKQMVKNTNGCTDTISRQIEIYNTPEAIFSVSDICVTDSFYLTDESKGAEYWFWDFSDGNTATMQHPAHKYNKAGIYTIYLIVSNSNGCVSSVSHIIKVDSTCVWPGDANADKVVNNKDILAIGIAYSDTGSARKDTNTIWKGKIVNDWSKNFSSGANYKHADCNGNGDVSSSDTSAVTRNYTKTHAKKYLTSRGKNTDPVLKLEIQNDSLKAGDTLIAYIVLGENTLPAKDVYGLALSINYNKDYLTTPEVDFTDNWLGDNILNYANTSNSLDIAFSRTDHQNISGYGKIATVKFVANRNSQIDLSQVNLEITDNILISAKEDIVPTNVESDSVKVYKEPNSIIGKSKNDLPEIRIYPNPFNDQAVIEYNLMQPGNVNIMLYDISGRWQLLKTSSKLFAGKHQFILDAKQYNICSGVYILKIEVNGNTNYKRIVKID